MPAGVGSFLVFQRSSAVARFLQRVHARRTLCQKSGSACGVVNDISGHNKIVWMPSAGCCCLSTVCSSCIPNEGR